MRSLSVLVVIVVLIALASASLVNPGAWCPNLLFTIAILCPLFFVVQVILGQGSSRAFAIGFVVFSLGYLGAAFGPFQAQFQPAMLTTTAFSKLCEAARRDVPRDSLAEVPRGIRSFNKRIPLSDSDGDTDMVSAMDGMDGGMGEGMGGMDMGGGMGDMGGVMGGGATQVVRMISVPFEPYVQRACHSLFALLLGIVGGCLGRQTYSRSRQQR